MEHVAINGTPSTADAERTSLTNRHAVTIIGVMLRMAEEGGPVPPGSPASPGYSRFSGSPGSPGPPHPSGPSPPFFPVDHVCRAIEGLAGKKDAAAAREVLQTQVGVLGVGWGCLKDHSERHTFLGGGKEAAQEVLRTQVRVSGVWGPWGNGNAGGVGSSRVALSGMATMPPPTPGRSSKQ